MPEEFQERSSNARNYVAIRHLPDNNGTYAFVALDIDKENPEESVTVAPCSVDEGKLDELKLMRKFTTAPVDESATNIEVEDNYVKNIEARLAGTK